MGELLRRLLELLSGEGGPFLAVAALGAIGAPLVQRYLARRKRVLYRVQSDSKIGLTVEGQAGEITLHGKGDADRHADEELVAVAKVVNRLSFAVIRIRNAGGPVSFGDLDGDVRFTFGGREIWNARISDAAAREDQDDRAKLADALRFFTDAGETAADPPPVVTALPEMRRNLLRRMQDAVRRAPAAPVVTEPAAPPPVYHGIRFDESLSLTAKEKFKLIVVLREPDANRTGHVTKGVTGPRDRKRIKDERTLRRAVWPLVTAGLGVLLAGLLLAVNVLPLEPEAAGPTVACASGDLEIVGSSAFAPIMTTIAGEYASACAAAAPAVRATGSITGVRAVNRIDQDRRDTLAALSDGRSGEATSELEERPVAVIVYAMVANAAAGVDGLTAEQVAGIYAGRYRDWRELGGAALPIRIVGRGGESGSRSTFERTVLDGGSQGELTSNSCDAVDRPATSATILCERDTEQEVVDEVAATPGAIGYIDVPAADVAIEARRPISVLRLDGRYPNVSSASAGYPFWTVEFLYTKGVPADDSVLAAVIEYLRGGAARAALADAGYTPCVGADGQVYELCRD